MTVCDDVNMQAFDVEKLRSITEIDGTARLPWASKFIRRFIDLKTELEKKPSFVNEVIHNLRHEQIFGLYKDGEWRLPIENMFYLTDYCLSGDMLDLVLKIKVSEHAINDLSPIILRCHTIEINCWQLMEICPLILKHATYTCFRKFRLEHTQCIKFDMGHVPIEYLDRGGDEVRHLTLEPNRAVNRFPFMSDLFWFCIDEVLPMLRSIEIYGDDQDRFDVSPATIPDFVHLEMLHLEVGFCNIDYNRLLGNNTLGDARQFLTLISKTLKLLTVKEDNLEDGLFFESTDYTFPKLYSVCLSSKHEDHRLFIPCDEEHMPAIQIIRTKGLHVEFPERKSDSLKILQIETPPKYVFRKNTQNLILT